MILGATAAEPGRPEGRVLPGISGLGAPCSFTGPVFYVQWFADMPVENSVGLAYKARSDTAVHFHGKSGCLLESSGIELPCIAENYLWRTKLTLAANTSFPSS